MYDDEAGLGTTARQQALTRLDEVAAAHCKVATPSLRAEMIAEFTTIPHASPCGDSNYPGDLHRYLPSSLHRPHPAALGPLLAAPTRRFSLDPVWRYLRVSSSHTLGAEEGGAWAR